MQAKKIATTALLFGIALIIGIIENALPPILPALPYARLGLSNLVVLFSLVTLGFSPSLVIVIGKSILVAIFSGRVTSILYSLPSGLGCILFMELMLRIKKFSPSAIGMGSGVIHNILQIFVAFVVTKSVAVFAYLPYLASFGAAAGLVTGMACHTLIKAIPEKSILSLLK